MDETMSNHTTETQLTDSAPEYLKNNHEETEENGLEKLVFKHNDSVKLKSYQKLSKKQHLRRSHKKGSHVVDGAEKQAECQGSAAECQTHDKDDNQNTDKDSIQGKKVHYGGETRVRSLSGVEEESDDEGCNVQAS